MLASTNQAHVLLLASFPDIIIVATWLASLLASVKISLLLVGE
jgi:hypothetical protein